MPAIITSVISFVAGKFKENLFGGSGGTYQNATMDQGALVYPLDLRSASDRPVVRFTAFERKNKQGGATHHHIYFPAPPGIAFSETANYNTINLGALGGAAQSAISAGADAFRAGGGMSGALSAAGSNIASQAKSLKAGEVAALAAKYSGVVGDDLKGAIGLATGSVVNPNTNTTFEGNSVRSFGFTFKLVARSAAETEVIRRIHNKFRAFSYADADKNANNLVLSYPPVWNIDFLNMQTASDNPYIPKLFSCYLTGVQSTFNTTSGAFHRDGAPLEIDISLSYQETRALNRQDILDLEDAQNLSGGRGIDENGLAVPQRSGEGHQAAPAAVDTNPGSGNEL